MRNLEKFAVALSVITLSSATVAAADPIKVVASFSIIGDLATQVGGDRIALRTLVGPDGDAHVYEPKPADAGAVAGADVVLVNGLQLEGFLARLVEASGTKAPLVEVSKGIQPIKNEEEGEHEDHGHAEAEGGHDHHHGEFDPHAWQSVPNAEIYVKNIADAFCAADAQGCDTYRTNAQTYTAKLKDLDKQVRDAIGSIPEDKRTIITTHDAFGYFEHEYGIRFLAPEGLSTDAEASAADVAHLIRQVRDDKASAIFVENITNPRLIEQIASETGLKVGGTLYSDALSSNSGPASTYIDMMQHNVETMRDAVLGS